MVSKNYTDGLEIRITELQQRNAELESMLVEVNNNRTGVSPCAKFCEALAAKKMFDNLQRERDELAAQSERLKVFITKSAEKWSGVDDLAATFNTLMMAVNSTPTQYLAEHDREVAARAVNKFSEHLIWDRMFAKSEVRAASEEYANQIRQQAKDGE